jgi:LmbE family N-acetylglucosaminyl deacetylase
VSLPHKLLCIVAHPDDECFAFGGALALAAERGIQTTVLCLTDGQAATNRGDATSNADLGAIRRAEFAASCDILGVHHHQLLDYQDARLEFADFSQTAGRLVEHIRHLQPDLVLTFGPDGGLNTHPDHMMVSMLTTAAYHWAARPKRYPAITPLHQPKRLYYLSTSHFIPDRQPPQPMPWTVALDIRSVFPRKQQAFAAHVSQAPLMEKTRELFAKYGSHEHYTLAATTDPQPAQLQTDLFEALD